MANPHFGEIDTMPRHYLPIRIHNGYGEKDFGLITICL